MKVSAKFIHVLCWLLLAFAGGRAEIRLDCLPYGDGAVGTGQYCRTQRVEGLNIAAMDSMIILIWNPASDATYYRVYSCSNPDGLFEEDLGGTFIGTQWNSPLSDTKRYYYVTSVTSVLTVEAMEEDGWPLTAWVYGDAGFIGYTPLTILNYSPGTYYVWCPPIYPDGSWLWNPTEMTLADNLIDRNLV